MSNPGPTEKSLREARELAQELTDLVALHFPCNDTPRELKPAIQGKALLALNQAKAAERGAMAKLAAETLVEICKARYGNWIEAPIIMEDIKMSILSLASQGALSQIVAQRTGELAEKLEQEIHRTGELALKLADSDKARLLDAAAFALIEKNSQQQLAEEAQRTAELRRELAQARFDAAQELAVMMDDGRGDLAEEFLAKLAAAAALAGKGSQ